MTTYALPTHIGPDSVTIHMANHSATKRSPFTGADQVLEYPYKRFGMDVDLPPMDHADARLWVGFLAKLNGRKHTFTMGDPAGAVAQGEAGGTPRIKGAGQTGEYLNIDGATVSQADWLLSGDYIQIGTGSSARLFMVTEAVTTDAAGNAELQLWPKITSAPTDNHRIYVSGAVGVWRLTSDVTSFDIRTATNYGISFSAETVI